MEKQPLVICKGMGRALFQEKSVYRNRWQESGFTDLLLSRAKYVLHIIHRHIIDDVHIFLFKKWNSVSQQIEHCKINLQEV